VKSEAVTSAWAWRLLSCIENQFTRRNLSKYDRGVLALQLEEMYAAEAKKRQLSTLKQNTTDVQKSAPREDAGKTRDKVAAIAGISHDTLRKVKVIETEAAKGTHVRIIHQWRV
jgi:hypothetical protein